MTSSKTTTPIRRYNRLRRFNKKVTKPKTEATSWHNSRGMTIAIFV
jgi:hypothetical protein